MSTTRVSCFIRVSSPLVYSITETSLQLKQQKWKFCTNGSDVAALARSHMNGSLPFEKTIEQTI